MQVSWIARRLAVGSALAAATAASAQTPAWNGFYGGVEAGAAHARFRVAGSDAIPQLTNLRPAANAGPIIVVPGTARDFDGAERESAPLYGAFAGFQWQTGALVLGIEADLHGPRDAARFEASYSLPPTLLAPASTATIAREAHIRYDWSARARLGFAAGAGTLLYATGGLAQTSLRFAGEDSFQTPAGPAAPNSTPGVPTFQSPAIGPVVITVSERARLTGWTAGIGGERRLSRHLGVGLDLRYTDYGSRNFALAQDCIPFSVATSGCGGGTLSAAPFDIPGRGTATYTDTNFALPGAVPSETRMSLTEWRLAARLVWRF